MTKNTFEDYVKAIHQICLDSETDVAQTGVLARRIGVSDATASRMIRNLAGAGLVVFAPYEGAQLTKEGRVLALRIIRRHRLIELFLTTVLGMGWDEVHEEAELLEHAVSDKLTDRIDDFLGKPTVDPHGDPIPGSDGSMPDGAVLSLDQCEPQTDFVVSRVLDQSPALLRYLSTVGVCVGARGKFCQKSTMAGVISIKLHDRVVALGNAIAEKILVATAPQNHAPKTGRDSRVVSTRK